MKVKATSLKKKYSTLLATRTVECHRFWLKPKKWAPKWDIIGHLLKGGIDNSRGQRSGNSHTLLPTTPWHSQLINYHYNVNCADVIHLSILFTPLNINPQECKCKCKEKKMTANTSEIEKKKRRRKKKKKEFEQPGFSVVVLFCFFLWQGPGEEWALNQ